MDFGAQHGDVDRNLREAECSVTVWQMMQRLDLQAASTRFQPLRNHTYATYIPKDSRYNPLHLDHILTSSRWANSVGEGGPKRPP